MRAFAAIIGTMAVLALFAALATALGFFWGAGRRAGRAAGINGGKVDRVKEYPHPGARVSKTVKELRRIARECGICLGYEAARKKAMVDEIVSQLRYRERME